MPLYRHLDFIHTFPKRVVSLVPSMTGSMFDLGMGQHLVGITDYCIYPKLETAKIPKIGGTKDFDVGKIIGLNPDLVIANQEENTRAGIEDLARNADVWLVFPQSVRAALDDLWELVHLYGNEHSFMRIRTLETAVEFAEMALVDHTPQRVFIPIWLGSHRGQTWWMTFNGHTYAGDVVRLLGAVNIFHNRDRKYPLDADLGMAESEEPGDRDIRYPCVPSREIVAARPEIIFLPSEPYLFSEKEKNFLAAELSETPAVQNGNVIRMDGSLITWHGTWIGKALAELGGLIL